MKETLNLEGKDIEYTLKRSKRAKYLRLNIYPDRGLTVTLPWFVGVRHAERYIREKSVWVLKNLRDVDNSFTVKSSRSDYLKNKELARRYAKLKVEHFNQYYNFDYKNIYIRNQKTRWGSCSSRGNLNFNYKIIKLPEKLADYIIVHEICHLKEMNHGRSFWDLVEKLIPEHKSLRKEFRNIKIF